MLVEHQGKAPRIHPTPYVAPNATSCGEVTIGEDCRVLFGAIILAEGEPVEIGRRCIVEDEVL